MYLSNAHKIASLAVVLLFPVLSLGLAHGEGGGRSWKTEERHRQDSDEGPRTKGQHEKGREGTGRAVEDSATAGGGDVISLDGKTQHRSEGVPAYQGVVPGLRDRPPRFEHYARRAAPYLLWLGYNAPDGKVFLLLTKYTRHQVVRGELEGEVHLELHDARLPDRNTGRHLDFKGFNLPFVRVQARRTSSGVRVTFLTNRGNPQLQISQSGDFLHVGLD